MFFPKVYSCLKINFATKQLPVLRFDSAILATVYYVWIYYIVIGVYCKELSPLF